MRDHLMRTLRRNRERGVTLIELMISITIGLILLGTLSYIYVGSRTAFRANDNLARVQEVGRFALDYLSRDLRMASFAGCRSRGLDNTNVNPMARPAVAFTGVGSGLVGYENGTGWTNPTTIARVAGSDVIVLRRAAGASVEIASNTTMTDITLKNNCLRFRRSEVVVLASCEAATVFRITNDPDQTCTAGSVTPVVLQHGHMGAGTDGTQGNGFVGDASSALIYNFDLFKAESRATVHRFQETAYFIGTNAGGRLPSLYRVNNGAAEELVENVTDMDVLYGVNSDGDAAGVADAYVSANAVTNWAQVVSVRLSLLVASPDLGVATQTQSYVLRDVDNDGALDRQDAADTRLRQVFTTTVAVRNLNR